MRLQHNRRKRKPATLCNRHASRPPFRSGLKTFLAARAGKQREIGVLKTIMTDVKQDTGDPRHAGRMYDKEMPIHQAGMEMSKPGLPDLRRRKHSVPLPEDENQKTS